MRAAYFFKGLKQSLALIRQGRFRVLAGKLRHRVPLRSRPLVAASDAWKQLHVPPGEPLVLVVDTGSGGGSTQYRDRLLKERRDRGENPVCLAFDLRSGYALLGSDPAGDDQAAAGVCVGDYAFLDAAHVPRNVSAIYVGTLARFPMRRC